MTRAPWSRAAWAKSSGNWPLPAIKPMFSDIRRQQAPLRGLQKRAGGAWTSGLSGQFLAHLVHGLFQLEVGEEQEFVGPFQACREESVKPARFRPTRLRPTSLARLPTAMA